MDAVDDQCLTECLLAPCRRQFCTGCYVLRRSVENTFPAKVSGWRARPRPASQLSMLGQPTISVVSDSCWSNSWPPRDPGSGTGDTPARCSSDSHSFDDFSTFDWGRHCEVDTSALIEIFTFY
ncbi:hypothetical protein J6590_039051 [Homalodisca vitripennis]|nr:hypothetical protein J6590_039051 [Homalodisca vitripennis]